MKKKLYIISFFIILSFGIMLIFTFHGINNQEKIAKEVISNIYSNQNLNVDIGDIGEDFETELRNKYSKYFTEKGFKVALSNRVFTSFPALLKSENVKNIRCLSVDLEKGIQENEYTYTAKLSVSTDIKTVTETISGIIRFENSKSDKIQYISNK